jgi:hypothetical protein|tara:strand:+ start:2265 stop:2996 length:732 start_codon:yes stop_codon:yes gene_type:complete
MATTEEKTELVETLKGPRFYRIRLYGYGGEAAYINIDKEAYKFWHKHTEEHGDGDFVNYMINDDPEHYEFENLTDIPPEADFLRNVEEEYKYQWYEAEGEFCHQNGVEYGSAYMTVEEVSSDDYNSDIIADVIDGENVVKLVDKIQEESDYEIEPGDFGEADEYEPQGEYVAQMYSSEKGTFFEGRLETTGEFDSKKLKFIINEYPNGEDIITSLEYNGVDIENDGAETNGKGYSAHVWSNID